MTKYGLISETDARCLEKTMDLIMSENRGGTLRITEIGLYNCATIDGMYKYIRSKGGEGIFTGIDNEKDKPIENDQLFWLKFIKGNSSEVYNQIEDNSQHLIFVDGCHCFAHVVSDFFCYADKVKVGGYMAFHDTGKHIKQFKDFQHGDKDNPDAYISVRKALDRIGLFSENVTIKTDVGTTKEWVGSRQFGWKLILDEADENDEAGGICVLKKLF